jgi:hypothetical protein
MTILLVLPDRAPPDIISRSWSKYRHEAVTLLRVFDRVDDCHADVKGIRMLDILLGVRMARFGTPSSASEKVRNSKPTKKR